VSDAVDGRARHGVPEPGGLEVGAGQLVAGWTNRLILDDKFLPVRFTNYN
jgi:hypothetical protein